MADPPSTRTDPTVDEYHGIDIEDPYRWLEGSSEDVADWERRQNAYTDRVIDAAPRDRLQEAFADLAAHETFGVPTIRGGRYFQLLEPAAGDRARLVVGEEAGDVDRVLVDPAGLGETAAIGWFSPSPEGTYVCYGVMRGGTEEYDLHVLDVEAGVDVGRIEDTGMSSGFAIGWTDEGFFYSQTGSAAEGGLLEKELRFREFSGDDAGGSGDDAGGSDEETPLGGADRLVTDDIPPKRWPAALTDPETGLVVVGIGEVGAGSDLYRLADGRLEPLVTGIDADLQPVLANGTLFLRTTHEAPRGRILALDAASVPDATGIEDFEELCRGEEDVLFDFAPTRDGFVVHRIRDATSVLSIHDRSGATRFELDLPAFSGIQRGGLAGNREAPEVCLLLEGYDRPTGLARVDTGPEAGPTDWAIVREPDLPDRFDPRGDLELVVRRLWAESTEGADVPVSVVHRADLAIDGNRPTRVYAYGGFRIPLLPGLDEYRLPFLADGGVHATVHARGGFEFGEAWHEAGRRERKPNTFADVAAGVEAVIDAGYTNPGRIGFAGRSNGGLTAGAMLVRRPDLFATVESGVPLLDMLRFHHFLLGRTWTAEYGDPADPEAFEWLREVSPYHNVEAVDYPATLFWTSAGDARVDPAHARKMTARVQAATTGEAPICFRSYEETGHGMGTPTWLEVEQAVDRWAFCYRALGMS